MFRRFGYNLKEGLKSIFRNKIFSFATIGTIIVCILLIGATFAVILNVRQTMKQAEDSVTISVYFDEKITDDEKEEIEKQIKQDTRVESVVYVSAKEAWEKYKKEVFEGNEDMLEGFEGDNPLNESDSYEIVLKDVKYHSTVIEKLEKMQGVRKVEYAKDAADSLAILNRFGLFVAGGFIFVLLFVSIFLVSNTTSIGVTVRREEIAIMRLMGATNRLIRGPFIMEGILMGIVGAIVPLSIIYAGYQFIVKYFIDKFHVLTGVIRFVPVEELMRYLGPIALLIGIFIGLIGSNITIRKYLKV